MIRFYNPETRRLTGWGRLGVASAALGPLTLTSCSGEAEPTGNPEGTAVVLQWPGRVALQAECPTWSHNNRGTYMIRDAADGKKELFVTIDARLGAPRICDPEEDTGAGAQRGASATSGAVQMPDNPERYKAGKFIKNGTVVQVVRFTNQGELTCQSDGMGETRTWAELQAAPKDPTFWTPIALTTYLPTANLLARAGIPEDPAQRQYAQSAQGGC